MSNVLITGASGFVGSALAEKLLKSGHKVISMTRDRTRTPAGTVVFGDVTDYEFCRRVIADYEVEIVYHLAAQAIVSACAEDPVSAMRVSVMGTVCLLQAVRDAGRSIRVVCSTCYDEKTRAVTPNGLKRFDELKIGDTVFSLNADGEMVESKIEEIVVNDYSGPMVRFDGKNIDLLVTPNHRMLIEKQNVSKERKLEFIYADTQVAARGWKIPTGRWRGTDKKIEIGTPPHWNAKKIAPEAADEDLLYLLGIYIGDGCTQHQGQSGDGITAREYVARPRQEGGRFAKLPPEVKRGKRGRSNTVYFYIPERDKSRKKVEEALERVGVDWKPWRHGGEGAIWFSSSQLCELFEQAGKMVYEKRIPQWTKELPPGKLSHLLQGILDSDGSKDNQVITTSWLLVQDLIEVITKCGMCVTYTHCPPPKEAPQIKGRPIVSRGCYRVYLSRRNGQSRSILPDMQSHEHYKGKVWCLRVPPHGNFLVEREGRVMFCGNSDKVYGSAPSPYDEQTPLDARHAYEVSKACQDLVARMYFHNYNVDVRVVRAVNIYGPGDPNETRLIPQTARRLLRGEPPLLHAGAAGMKRQYVYIADLVRALEIVCERGKAGEAYCVGSHDPPMSVLDVMTRMAEVANVPMTKPEVKERDARFHEIAEQSVNDDKIRGLGWSPEIGLTTGLWKTLVWYREQEQKAA